MSTGSVPSSSPYQPGVCNIGPVEIAMRRRSGHIGALATLLLFALLVGSGIPPAWRLLLFLPAAGSATGYLQAKFHFCAGFGLRGVFNFSAQLQNTSTVMAVESRAADRRQAFRVIGLASLIGIAVAVAALLLPI